MSPISKVSLLVLSISILALAAFSLSGVEQPPAPGGRIIQFGTEAQRGHLGYLINLKVQSGQVRLVSAADIDNYVESKQLATEDNWYALLLNSAWKCIGAKVVGNPFHLFPHFSADQEFPLTMKIPRLEDLAAVAICNEVRQEVLWIPIDDSFKKSAAANREKFLAHDRLNRQLLVEEARTPAQKLTQGANRRQTPQRYENLPKVLQDQITREMSLEIERRERIGPGIMNRSKDRAMEPGRIERRLSLPNSQVGVETASVQSNRDAAQAHALTGHLTILGIGMQVAGVSLNIHADDSGASGSISGKVMRDSDGTGISGVRIDAFDSSWTNVKSATTDYSGSYSIGGLSAGKYYLETWNNLGFVDEYYNNVTSQLAATAIAVTAGMNTANISFSLALGGTISGKVTRDSDGTGISGVPIQAFDSSWNSFKFAGTDSSGSYSVDGLPAGNYYIKTRNTLGFVDEYYNNVSTQSAATAVAVTVGINTSNINFGLAPGGSISGKVTRDSDGTGISGVQVYAYDSSWNYAITDTSGSYSIVGLPAGNYFLQTGNSLGFLDEYYNNVTFRSAATAVAVSVGTNISNINFGLALGGSISGKVTRDADGTGISGIRVHAWDSNWGEVNSATTDSSGSYSIAGLPAGYYYLQTENSLGFVDEYYNNVTSQIAATAFAVAPGTTTANINFKLEKGWAISGIVTGDGGAAIAGASVLLRQIAGTTSSPYSWSALTDTSGRYSLVLPENLLPNNFVMSAYAQNYLRGTISLTVAGDATQNFQLARGLTVSGTVRDNNGKSLEGMRVRAYQGSNLVISTLTASDGTYSLPLSAGTYDLQILPGDAVNPPSTGLPLTFAPVTVPNIIVSGPLTRDFTLSPATGMLTVKFYCPDFATANLFSHSGQTRFELSQSGKTLKVMFGWAGQSALVYDPSVGKYYLTCTLYIENGRYDLITYFPGCQPFTLSNIDVSGSAVVSSNAPAPYLWTGVLRGADHAPLADVSVLSYGDTARMPDWLHTDASGRFSIPLTPNGFVKFFTNEGSSNILYTERIGKVMAGRNADCILEAFPTFTDTGSPLTQIYGIPDRTRSWNIVMIGDGYTGVNETYTDVNKNGQWDGVLYYDLNKNGVWDSGEPYQVYGNASEPVSGKDPTINNEPFTDLNHDGAPNLHDQALFDRNTLDVVRSFFGQDLWKLHRDAFNIFRIRVVSTQAGQDFLDMNGKPVITRDTALGTYLMGTPDRGYSFGGDDTLISQYINQYVPECDTRIVLINQPIRYGFANSYIFLSGGELGSLSNDSTIAHEMGHNIGWLWDEYGGVGAYSGAEYASPNTTALSDPAQIPWKHLLTPGKEIPSVPGSGGVGLFEGGGTYNGGRYRPTDSCMMAGGDRFCPVCTEAIEVRMADLTGQVQAATPLFPVGAIVTPYPRFGWEGLPGVSHSLLELEKADGSALVASYDIYDTGFTLPFALGQTGYRWRIRSGSSAAWSAWSSWMYFQLVPQSCPDGSCVALGLNTGGSASAITMDGAGATQDGYALLDAGMGAAPYGTAVFRYIKNGITIGETGVPASPPTTAARIFIDYRSAVAAVPGRPSGGNVNVNTGIAVVNHNSTSAAVTYTLRDIAGATLSIGHGPIAAGAHFAKFINELNQVAPDFILPSGFQILYQFASLEISSDQPLSILALRMTTNQRNEALFTTTPTADLTQAATNAAIFFPQFADGGGYTTSLVLLNTSNGIETGTLQILDDNGNPFVVNQVGSASGSVFRYSIPNGGLVRFQTDGTLATTKTGWAQLTPDPGTSTPVCAGVFSNNPGNFLVNESGIPATVSTTHARIYVDLSGGHNTGLAIANPSDTTASIAITAFQSDGVTGIGTSQGPLKVPAHGHSAHFADEFVAGLPADFTGVLDILSSTPFAALTMRSLYNGGNDFLLATFPIADMTRVAPAPIIFPQIADGGGYVTQFILIGASGASSVTLSFYGNDGKPLPVGK
jgi:hypothetical protein